MIELGIRSPGGGATAKHDPSPHSQTAAPPVKMVSGEQLVKNAQKKARSMSEGETKPHPPTPARDSHLTPQSITMEKAAVPMETDVIPRIKQEQPVKQEPPSSEQLAAVAEFCTESLGKGVLSMADLRNRLLLKQTSLAGESPLHVLSQQGVSDHVLGEGLRLSGAVEIGQPWNKSLFALPHSDPVSTISCSWICRLIAYRCA